MRDLTAAKIAKKQLISILADQEYLKIGLIEKITKINELQESDSILRNQLRLFNIGITNLHNQYIECSTELTAVKKAQKKDKKKKVIAYIWTAVVAGVGVFLLTK